MSPGADFMVAKIIWLKKILNSVGASVQPCHRPWEISNGGVVLPCIDTWALGGCGMQGFVCICVVESNRAAYLPQEFPVDRVIRFPKVYEAGV